MTESQKKSRIPESQSREKELVEALNELGEILKENEITLDRWIESGRRIRGEIIKEQYPNLKPTKRRRAKSRYPAGESLQGATGKLERPTSWKKMKEIIQNERAEKVREVLRRSRGK